MKALELYEKLKKDFIKDSIKDVDWAKRMPNLDKYLFPAFKQNGGIGLMCDFTTEIEKVYTTVFLSEKVLSKILNDNVTNAMLFSHHPTNWDLKEHNGNYAADEKLIAKLKERNISIYILHHPLDNFGKYSTCRTLADKLNIVIEKPAFLYFGAMCGVIGTTECDTVSELHERYTGVVGHKTSLCLYGNDNLKGEKIAICPGGGNIKEVAEEMLDNNVRTLITGVTIVNDYSRGIHEFEKENEINLLGGTHYSSEKYAPMAMCEYFNDLGLPSEFIDDEPDLFDL
ncbi:MAG: Nif3-like dinuclear metal center hexameric protein [Oscillospiraceae bacterium]|nr:Nif3-like dinuclear metal center hexameric protein [Oscillospiraceae bacterium]